MLFLRPGTRMIQTLSSIKTHTYLLINNTLDDYIEIGEDAANLLRKIYKNNSIDNNEEELEFSKKLLDLGFFSKEKWNQEDDFVYLGKRYKDRFPLTSLNIELTNACNLKCEHCYGEFSDCYKKNFLSYSWIKESLEDLNRLHVKNVALTGGEATMHPYFQEIAMFFLEHGFELCILTNGYNYQIIEQLLEKAKSYRFSIKVSLDGSDKYHNQIRGNTNAYMNTLRTLNAISKYPNVTLYISTIVMKNNIDNIVDLDRLIENTFPNAIHTKDLVFPLGNAVNTAFRVNEFCIVDQKIPNFLTVNRVDNIDTKKKS